MPWLIAAALSDGLYITSGSLISFSVIFVGILVRWEITAKAIDALGVERGRVWSPRIEMRLFSDTRSVLEYLTRLLVSTCG